MLTTATTTTGLRKFPPPQLQHRHLAPQWREYLLFLKNSKCPHFSGKRDKNVFEWVEEKQASLRARHLLPVEKALFIIDYLEGLPRGRLSTRLNR